MHHVGIIHQNSTYKQCAMRSHRFNARKRNVLYWSVACTGGLLGSLLSERYIMMLIITNKVRW